MIKTLKRKLFLLFAGTFTLVFTAAFIVIIHSSHTAYREDELDRFEQTSAGIMRDLATRSYSANSISVYEDTTAASIRLEDMDGNVIHQTAPSSRFPDAEEVILALKPFCDFGDYEYVESTAENVYEISMKYEDVTGEDHAVSGWEQMPVETITVTSDDVANEEDIETVDHYYFAVSGVNAPEYYKSNITGLNVGGKPYLGTSFKSSDYWYTLYIAAPKTSLFTYLGKGLLIWSAAILSILISSWFLIGRVVRPTQRAMESQKSFIASASHELKAPLAVIMANTEVLENKLLKNKNEDGTIFDAEKNLPDGLEKNLDAIDKETERMSGLIQDLLLLSYIDAETWSLSVSRIDVTTLIVNLYEKYEPLCAKAKIRLTTSCDNDVFPEFTADEARLEQILGVLLDNAVHYSPEGSDIKLSASTCGKWMTFTVEDHGCGISAEDKPHIYERFYQADRSRTEKDHYGLGLSIAKELVDMHKGRIELYDTPEGGCTFKIFLPLGA